MSGDLDLCGLADPRVLTLGSLVEEETGRPASPPQRSRSITLRRDFWTTKPSKTTPQSANAEPHGVV
jgi:hypothetical protein